MTTFDTAVTVTGHLHSTFEFESEQAADNWISTEFVKLSKLYPGLTYSKFQLPSLKIGDQCYVVGEGSDVFTILGVKNYSPNRYGFILDAGWCEEVYKCYQI